MNVVWLPVTRWECHVGMYDFVREAEKSHRSLAAAAESFAGKKRECIFFFPFVLALEGNFFCHFSFCACILVGLFFLTLFPFVLFVSFYLFFFILFILAKRAIQHLSSLFFRLFFCWVTDTGWDIKGGKRQLKVREGGG